MVFRMFTFCILFLLVTGFWVSLREPSFFYNCISQMGSTMDLGISSLGGGSGKHALIGLGLLEIKCLYFKVTVANIEKYSLFSRLASYCYGTDYPNAAAPVGTRTASELLWVRRLCVA